MTCKDLAAARATLKDLQAKHESTSKDALKFETEARDYKTKATAAEAEARKWEAKFDTVNTENATRGTKIEVSPFFRCPVCLTAVEP